MKYYDEIQHLENALSHSKHTDEELSDLQLKLNNLFQVFQDDEEIGNDRYGMYQVQAMISYRQGDYDKARRFIDYSVEVRGEHYKLADELVKHLMKQDFVSKSEKKWWILIFAPAGALILVALLQIIVHFIKNTGSASSSSNPVTSFVNIISILVGVVAVILLVLLPIWIIELSYVKKYNTGHGYTTGLRKRTGVLISIFLATWYWFYTYKTDSRRFWINFLLGIFTAGYWTIVAWIWAMISSTGRPDAFYRLYPYYDDLPKSIN